MARQNVQPLQRAQAAGPALAATDPLEASLARISELLRRCALGLVTALVVARFFWPSEYYAEADTGNGLRWVFACGLAAALGIAALFVGGRTRLRWSWADGAVYALMLLVGLSTAHAKDRRVAINLAWEWGGLGITYALLRNLPRSRSESAAVAGVLTASAVAVAAYGLFQVSVEFPEIIARYKQNPDAVLAEAGIDPSSHARRGWEDRVLGSNEPFSTFALANSLAGFLVGPTVLALAVLLENLRNRHARGSLLAACAAAVVPGLLLVTCLLLTKSRSAYFGLAAAGAVLAWHYLARGMGKALGAAALAMGVLLAVLVTAAALTHHLDWKVLTESSKSLKYRIEYWTGTRAVLKNNPGIWWHGTGPGNFAGAYLLYKLPWASEEIRDPHNLVLDVWVTGGVWAMLALMAALGLAAWDLFRPARQRKRAAAGPDEHSAGDSSGDDAERDRVSLRAGWLVACGALGWVLASLVGQLNPFHPSLMARWAILGLGWGLAVLAGMPLWRRVPIPAIGAGAGALAVVVNLLAAGGIGFASVALGLWTVIALGLNLRDDRPCGRLREADGRPVSFALAVVWAALAGTFFGAIWPFWRAEAEMSDATVALSSPSPAFDRARAAYERAAKDDVLSVSPWVGLADLTRREWLMRRARGDDPEIWRAFDALDKASQLPRNPDSLSIQQRRSAMAREVLTRAGPTMPPLAIIKIKGIWVQAARLATRLYPNSAILHAELAEASGGMGELQGALAAAQEALRLDQLTPHLDKKLPDSLREHLQEQVEQWKSRKRETK
jgi:O-antigen ligase